LEKLDRYQFQLSGNPNAISLIERELQNNPRSEKIDWKYLSLNPNAIHLIEWQLTQHPKKIHWDYLSGNPNAIHLIEQQLTQDPEKINWKCLSIRKKTFRLDGVIYQSCHLYL